MKIPMLASFDQSDKVDSGTGYVHERSLEIGRTVVVIENIGSITLFNEKKNPLPVIIGLVVALFGLILAFSSSSAGIIILIIGAVILFVGITSRPDVFLLIGTCDGRRTSIVSKKREFLEQVQKFLRDKIDEKNVSTAIINVSAGTITGGIAVGDNAKATGASGNISS